jgi:hypothetical protein
VTVVLEHFEVKDQVTVEGIVVVVRSVHVRPYVPVAGAWKVSPRDAGAWNVVMLRNPVAELSQMLSPSRAGDTVAVIVSPARRLTALAANDEPVAVPPAKALQLVGLFSAVETDGAAEAGLTADASRTKPIEAPMAPSFRERVRMVGTFSQSGVGGGVTLGRAGGTTHTICSRR